MSPLIDYSCPVWESLPGTVREDVSRRLSAFSTAPEKGICQWFHHVAQELELSYQSVRRLYYEWISNGRDWHCLVDRRKAASVRCSVARSRSPEFAAFLVGFVEKYQRNNRAAFKALRRRWSDRREAIPGYQSWPGWPKIPAGWTDRNLYRILENGTNLARMRSIRVGTSSKTNPFLPTVLTTRVGLWPGAVIQLDDVFHDNLVTLGKRRDLVRVMELGALDLFSACRFHFGAKPRRRTESGQWENIRSTDMRMFLAGMFHRFGYSPRGTMLMSEHNTAKVSEDIARILYNATHGLIRVEYQPIEGKQSALCGFWNGTEGGNFRAKACLESTHNLMHNDLAALPMQTGSPSSGVQGPVTTDRIISYIERILRDVARKAPHLIDLLRLPSLDFHSQFYPFLLDYYELGLNGRTDHSLEGWEALGHVINEYTLAPGSGQFIAEAALAALPAPSQLAIREAARLNPAEWSRRRSLSPAEVWNRREKFIPLPNVIICDMLGGDLAREARSARGFIEFSDQEISAEPLIYQARYISGPHAGREIPHGETVRLHVLPFDPDTAIVTDARERLLGEIPLYKRVTAIDPAAFQTSAPYESRPDIRSAELTRAAAEKHSRIADILEPARIMHREAVQEAKDLREHNRRVIAGEPLTEAERRSAGALQGQRTAAANRLQAHGSAPDWDHPQPSTDDSEIRAAWDDLPEDSPLPEAL